MLTRVRHEIGRRHSIALLQLPPSFVLKGQKAVVNSIFIDCNLSTDRLLQRYSSLLILLKTIALLVRYKLFSIFHVRRRLNLPYTDFVIFSRYPSAEELQYAKFELIKYVQFQYFSSLIKICSSKNRTLTGKGCLFWKNNRMHSMKKLQPIVVDGVFRFQGRMERAPVQYGNKHPAILPNNARLTNLPFHIYHFEIGQSGV